MLIWGEVPSSYGFLQMFNSKSFPCRSYSDELQQNHKSNLEQLIHRDRNHPSVIMWSIANEPRSDIGNAGSYFSEIARYTKQLDPTRPITAAINQLIGNDRAAQYLDIISVNR